MALPTNVNYGTVTGAFIRGIADGVDADRNPDSAPIVGLEVTFTADLNPAIVRDTAAVPPVMIVIDPVVCLTNAQGILIGPDGSAGVNLVASADLDLDPHGWSWKCTLKGTNFPTQTFSFVLSPDQIIDLSTVVRVPANPGSAVMAWQEAVAATAANVAAAQAILDEIEAGGGSGAVASVAGRTGVVALTADDVADSTNKKILTAAERTKLAGIATAATANATDATLQARANHTGTQTSATISDFSEAVQDAVASVLTQGTGVTLTYNDAGNTLTVASTGGTFDGEAARDAIGAALIGVGNITVAVNDAADTITISTAATVNSTDAALRDRSTHTGSQPVSTISDSTTTGRAVVTATDAAAARTAIGAKISTYTPSLADLPAGSTVTVIGATRTSTRTDLRYIFINANDVPIVASPSLAGMYDGDIQIKAAN